MIIDKGNPIRYKPSMKTNRFSPIVLVFLCAALLLNACAAPSAPASPMQTASPTQIATLAGSPTSLPATQQPANTPTEASVLTEARLAEADAALQFGDYPAALQAYSAAKSSGSALCAPPGFLARGLLITSWRITFRQSQSCKNLPRPIRIPCLPRGLITCLRRLRLLRITSRKPRNIESLPASAARRPGCFVLEQVGDLQAQAGENELALEAYSAAYLASDPSQNAPLAIKVGGAYEKLGQLTPAAAIYRDVYARTEDIYLKAQLDLLLGRVSIAQGLVEEGFEYYQHAVDNYPETYDAFSAVLALLDAEQPVDELQRGLINYFRGQYDLANEAFSRYLEGDGLEKDKALYYQALAVRAKGLELAD
jgi:soluble lytic murein transglycosylase